MLKTVSLLVTQKTYEHAASRMAVALTKMLAGRFVAYILRPDPRAALPFVGEGLTAETIQTMADTVEAEGQRFAESAERYLTELAEKNGLVVDDDAVMSVLIGSIADHAGRKARVSDIAVCPQPTNEIPDATELLHDLLFKSGRLMVMVPKGAAEMGRHIVVGWNGRAECARAVGASLPLLTIADKVTVLQIGEIGEERPDLAELEDYLSAFRLNLECHRVKETGDRTAEAIHKHALDIGADTLLIGAYSHARWREMILGGATQWLVHNSKLPILMSH